MYVMESQLILAAAFSSIFFITMIVLKLKYKKQFNNNEVFKISFIIGFVVSLGFVLFGLFILFSYGIVFEDTTELFVAILSELIIYSVAFAAWGVVYYTIARYIIVVPIKKLMSLRK